ncbi:Hpt domain-containing protein [Verrucomicrobiaceae bacterium 227]
MSLIDKNQLDSISGGEPGLLLPILEDFVSTASELIAEIVNLDPSGQAEIAAARLHQLKGSSGTLGLSKFYEACSIAEDSCRSGMIPDLTGLQQLMSDSTAEAHAFLSSSGARPD